MNKPSDFEHIETQRSFDLSNDSASGILRLTLYTRSTGVESIKITDSNGSIIWLTPAVLARISGAIKLYEKST